MRTKLIHEEVILGNQVGHKFTNAQWVGIMTKLTEAYPGYSYTLKQLQGKSDRLKQRWKKYHRLLTRPGFGWDDQNGLILGSDEAWAHQQD
ncbi:hypothetical protein DH2020_018432 [Rehmannia glutinosa]|uniref:Myb/SANT-like domain-containing protein n=1 Tax=Rehmannia glutinosa TaxID=99300 RepID=A0ABR0WN50_REHGL